MLLVGNAGSVKTTLANKLAKAYDLAWQAGTCRLPMVDSIQQLQIH